MQLLAVHVGKVPVNDASEPQVYKPGSTTRMGGWHETDESERSGCYLTDYDESLSGRRRGPPPAFPAYMLRPPRVSPTTCSAASPPTCFCVLLACYRSPDKQWIGCPCSTTINTLRTHREQVSRNAEQTLWRSASKTVKRYPKGQTHFPWSSSD